MLLTSFLLAQSVVVQLGLTPFRINAAAFTTSAVEHFFAMARSCYHQGNMLSLYELSLFFERVVHELLKRFTDCEFRLTLSRSRQSYSLPEDKKPKYTDLFQLVDLSADAVQATRSPERQELGMVIANDQSLAATSQTTPPVGSVADLCMTDVSQRQATGQSIQLRQDQKALIYHLCSTLARKVPQTATRQANTSQS